MTQSISNPLPPTLYPSQQQYEQNNLTVNQWWGNTEVTNDTHDKDDGLDLDS